MAASRSHPVTRTGGFSLLYRPGQVPSGWTRRQRLDALPPIRGGAPEPGETPVVPAAPPPADPPAPKPADDEPFDRDRAMRTIEALRQEAKDAKALKKQVDDLAAQLKQRDDEKLSETERLTAKVTELTGKLAEVETVQQRADRLEAVLKTHLDAQRKSIEDKGTLDLLDKLDVTDQLEWIAKYGATSGTRPAGMATPRSNGQPQGLTPQQAADAALASGVFRKFG